MPLTIPNSFSDATTIEASEVNANFTAVANALGNITNADIADDAGITSKKLSDKFASSHMSIALTGTAGLGTTFNPQTLTAVPSQSSPDTGASSTTRIHRWYPTIKSGRRAYLIDVVLYAMAVQADTGQWPKVWVYHNGTLLSGDGATMSTVGPYYLQNNNPHDSPLATLSNGDYIDFHLGRDGGATTPDIAGLCASLTIKEELES